MKQNEWVWGMNGPGARRFAAVTVYTGVGQRIRSHNDFVQATSGANKYKLEFGATEHKVMNIQIHKDFANQDLFLLIFALSAQMNKFFSHLQNFLLCNFEL